jgi:TonB family protein
MIKLIFFITLFCVGTAFAQSSPSQKKSSAGSGLVLVDVDASGRVTGAKMIESTGDRRFDEAALRKFRQWRFKPGTPPQVKIPITFTVSGGSY